MITVESCNNNTNQNDCSSVSLISQSRRTKRQTKKPSRKPSITTKSNLDLKKQSSEEQTCGATKSLRRCCKWIQSCKHACLNKADSVNTMVISELERSNEQFVTNGQLDRRRVCINISGKRYETLESTLAKYPETLLAIPQRELFFDSLNGEYFFDRNRKAFGAILTYCQSGVLVKPPSLEERIFAAELRFFGFEAEADSLSHRTAANVEEVLPGNPTLKKIWELFEVPDSSLFAKAVSVLSMTVILTSIIMFCLETVPTFKEQTYKNILSDNGTILSRERSGFTTKKYYKPVFEAVEAACIAWFTLEYLLRLIASPKKIKFLYQPLNMIDVIAIAPFYLMLVLRNTNANLEGLSILRILRLVRVFRIFKLSRYSNGLKILGYTFRASLQELGLLAFFLLIGIILFASAVYYCEENVQNTKFTSILESFWWAIVTMTTVGYGDMVPSTPGGKLVGSICVLVGVLAIAFPVPVIVNNFTYYYTLEQDTPRPLDEEYLETPLGDRRNSSVESGCSENDELDAMNGSPEENKRKRKQGTTGENGITESQIEGTNIHFDTESPV